ncbi:MAG: preprotein translocase subunit SecB [Deltaproteobacteria bacterium]|nr:MAG: preprotein translocase subunit SecB [Deltaproteobacteria bacterium]
MMKIQLLHSIVDNLEMRKAEEEVRENNFSLSFAIAYRDEKKESDLFGIVFFLRLRCLPDLLIDMEFTCHFKTSEPVNDEFRNSHFPKINAPAMAFPFLRSFIATLTLNAGYEPIILPSVNFTKLRDTDKGNIIVEPEQV